MAVVEHLLTHEEPSVRFGALTRILGKNLTRAQLKRHHEEIRTSSRVKTLLSERDGRGQIPFSPYKKWCGAHWVLAALADLGYPPGDPDLIPLRDQVYDWLFGRKHEQKIKCIRGRVRRCASQEGNALHYLLCLGLADSNTDELARRLLKWQWPDGGWNCDKRPDAVHSSFMESLIPLRGLALHARLTGSKESQAAAEQAAEVFLQRRMYRSRRDGKIIQSDFLRLHYPCYWHYDILFGLKVMAEAGFISDDRCGEALDLLESKRLPDGGFPAEAKYYRVSQEAASGRSLVDWGGTNKKAMNVFITLDATYVLLMAGRPVPGLT